MTDTAFNYIAGQWQASRSGRTFADLNPADKTDCIGTFPRSDAHDVEAAVQAARDHRG